MKEALQLRDILGSFLDFCIWAHTSVYVLPTIRVAKISHAAHHSRLSLQTTNFPWILIGTEYTDLLGHEQVAAVLPHNILAWLHTWVLLVNCSCEIVIYTYYRYNSLATPLCWQHMQADQMHLSAFWLLCCISYQKQVQSPHTAAYHSSADGESPNKPFHHPVYSCLCPKALWIILFVISPPLVSCDWFSFNSRGLHSGCTHEHENGQNSPLGVVPMWGHGGNIPWLQTLVSPELTNPCPQGGGTYSLQAALWRVLFSMRIKKKDIENQLSEELI